MASAKRRSTVPDGLVLEEFLPYRLSILSNRVSRAIAARYAKTLTLTIPEWRVMAVLGRTPGLTSKDIAEATEMDKVAVSRAVARLVAARRVAAEVDAEDARRQLLWLTPQGEALYARIAPMALETEQRLLAALSRQDRAQLHALISRLLDAAQRL
ncbi:MAG: MarR family winged helix-turn-helix transcriptional regulator [Hyphomonadaceae bacterium]|nr:MarR family winged helix-turn-helix transcriptional regulator [Hyphomonadaceae bacterium]